MHPIRLSYTDQVLIETNLVVELERLHEAHATVTDPQERAWFARRVSEQKALLQRYRAACGAAVREG